MLIQAIEHNEKFICAVEFIGRKFENNEKFICAVEFVGSKFAVAHKLKIKIETFYIFQNTTVEHCIKWKSRFLTDSLSQASVILSVQKLNKYKTERW